MLRRGPRARASGWSARGSIAPSVGSGSIEIDDLDADLEPGTLGIPEPAPDCPEVEPEAVDWVLVPGLAFDAAGYRLGRGAGHYDRLLPTLRPDAPRWALAFDCQWVDDLPVEPHDVPLDGIVSPTPATSSRRSRRGAQLARPRPSGGLGVASNASAMSGRGGVALVQDHAVAEPDRLARRERVLARFFMPKSCQPNGLAANRP